MLNIIKLSKGELFRIKGHKKGVKATVQSGLAWVTVSGCSEDFVLKAGEELPSLNGIMLVESLSEELQLVFEESSCPDVSCRQQLTICRLLP